VLLRGARAKASQRLRAGQEIELHPPEPRPWELLPQPLPLRILYRDEHLVVVEKPPGMVVYPAPGHPDGTLLNALAYHVGRLASIGAPLRPGVVHRLDKDTSGLMVVALRDEAYRGLQRQFKDRTVGKLYQVLVSGVPRAKEGVIERPIGRARWQRKKFSTRAARAREAITHWRLLKSLRGASLLEVHLQTGRTHQIRVHFASLGHPVLGDRLYGRKTQLRLPGGRILKIPRQMLHASVLEFTHPADGQRMHFESPLPQDMQEVLRLLQVED